jgi:hypothetical protein
MEKKEKEQRDRERVDALFRFLGVIFTTEDMNEVERKEALYLVKFIRDMVWKCLWGRDVGAIPIFAMTLWGTYHGKTEIFMDASDDLQTLTGWKLSALAMRIKAAVDEWDLHDIGQKSGNVVSMMNKLGWNVPVKNKRNLFTADDDD